MSIKLKHLEDYPGELDGEGPYRKSMRCAPDVFRPPVRPWRSVSTGGSCPICGTRYHHSTDCPESVDSWMFGVTCWRCERCGQTWAMHQKEQVGALPDIFERRGVSFVLGVVAGLMLSAAFLMFFLSVLVW